MRSIKFRFYLVLSLCALLGAGLYSAQAWSDLAKYQIVFYYTRQTTFLLAFLLIPSSLVLTLSQIARLGRQPTLRKSLLPLWFSILVLVSANIIACGGILPLILFQQSNFDTVYLDNHVYRLDDLSSPEVGGGLDSVLALWECDATSWFCQIIETKDFYDDMTPALTTDVQDKTLLLLINGETVYRYTP